MNTVLPFFLISTFEASPSEPEFTQHCALSPNSTLSQSACHEVASGVNSSKPSAQGFRP